MMKLITSTCGLIISILLLVLSLFAMFSAVMQADDFDRELTTVETIISVTPIIPISWLLFIFMAKLLKLPRVKDISDKECVKATLIVSAISLFFVLCSIFAIKNLCYVRFI